MRIGRAANGLRKVQIDVDYLTTATGSALIHVGNTRVLCTAQAVPGVPGFLKGSGKGWLTAEYSMLPGATERRTPRPGLKPNGRSMEIQRLIGRALRAVTDLYAFPEYTIYIDCDVLQADGGTRCAAITGGFVALCAAVDRLLIEGKIARSPLTQSMSAVSVGIVDGELLLDLEYAEDSRAQVDMNIVMTQAGEFVEIQGTGEGRPFTRAEMTGLLDISHRGNADLMRYQAGALGTRSRLIGRDYHPDQLIVATNNAHKVEEIRAILGGAFGDIQSLKELGLDIDVEEDGSSFEENAVKKAREVMRLTGCCALADDSGLCVDALQGAPGIYSARYAGEGADSQARNAYLLEKLQGVKERDAQFHSVVALARPFEGVITAEGIVEGKILTEPRGTQGFGYDPLFFVEGYEKTYAELSAEEKNADSHRARALKALREKL